MKQWILLGFILDALVTCMQPSIKSLASDNSGNFALLARPSLVTDSFTLLTDEVSSINSLLEATNFKQIHDVELMFLIKPLKPVDSSNEGFMLSVPVPRASLQTVVLDNARNCQKLASGDKLYGHVTGYQVVCPSDLDSPCLFSLILRSKVINRKIAQEITSTFGILATVKPTVKPHFDKISCTVWSNEGMILTGEKGFCSWLFNCGHGSICFDQDSLFIIMELVKLDAFSKFRFERIGSYSDVKTKSFQVPSGLKSKLPVLMTNLSLRTGSYLRKFKPSMGFEKMTSFSFDCDQANCMVSVSYSKNEEEDLDVEKLNQMLQMGQLVSEHTSPVQSADNSAWIFYSRGQMILASLYLDGQQPVELKRLLEDINIILRKSQVDEEPAGHTVVTMKALGNEYYTVAIDMPQVDSNLPMLVFMINHEIMASITNGCEFLYHLVKIQINRKEQWIEFAFKKSIDVEKLRLAIKFLDLLCKLVEKKSSSPRVYLSTTQNRYAAFNLDVKNSIESPIIMPAAQEPTLEEQFAIAINHAEAKDEHHSVPEKQIKILKRPVRSNPVKDVPVHNSIATQNHSEPTLNPAVVTNLEEGKKVESVATKAVQPKNLDEEPKKLELIFTKEDEHKQDLIPNTKIQKPTRPAVQFKLSEVKDAAKIIRPKDRRALKNNTNPDNIFVENISVQSKSFQAADIVPVPKKTILYPIDLDEWNLAHCEFMACCEVPKKSPFTTLKDDMEFWVHKGPFDAKLKLEKLIRVFRPHQTITSLESLYYNYNNSVIDIFAEVPGQSKLGFFKKGLDPRTPAARTAFLLTFDNEEECLDLLNRFWEIAMMLSVKSDAPWYSYLHGVLLDPVSPKIFRIEAWWDSLLAGNLVHPFEDAFIEEAQSIAKIPHELQEWETIC